MKIIYATFLACVFLVSMAAAQQSHSGVYRKIDGSAGEVKIKEFLKGRSTKIEFDLSVSGSKSAPCAGDLKGTAKFINQNTFEYVSDVEDAKNCHLTFTFSGKKLTIRETECGFFHGAMCEFDGSYRKR